MSVLAWTLYVDSSLSVRSVLSPLAARDNSLHTNITAMHKVDTPPLFTVCYQLVSNQAERGTAYRCKKKKKKSPYPSKGSKSVRNRR